MLLVTLPDDKEFQVRFVVPKSVPTDVSGQAIDLTAFQSYPELIEGAGLYHFECTPTFLFGDFWMEQETIYFRPKNPLEAKHIFVNLNCPVETDPLRAYVAEHSIDHPTKCTDSPYFIMDLSYNEVEFNSTVDVGYHQEDYQDFRAKRLRELRAACQQRYQEYYSGSEKAAQ